MAIYLKRHADKEIQYSYTHEFHKSEIHLLKFYNDILIAVVIRHSGTHCKYSEVNQFLLSKNTQGI